MSEEVFAGEVSRGMGSARGQEGSRGWTGSSGRCVVEELSSVWMEESIRGWSHWSHSTVKAVNS